MIIYKTTNLINGKIYIGQDSHNNPNYLGSGKLLNRAIKRYGIHNFKKEVLEYCSDQRMLNEREIYWIDYYTSYKHTIGYNITLGGTGGNTWRHNPNKEMIREKLKQRPRHIWTEEEKDKQRGDANPAKRPEVRAKISQAKKGRANPLIVGELNPSKRDDVREKISQSLKGRKKPIVICPSCNKTGQPSNMYRWHFENCKLKNKL